MEFYKIDRTPVDLVEYTKQYLKDHPETELLIGGDSQNRGLNTYYAVVVAFYNPGKGAHIIYSRTKTSKEYDKATRLIKEVWNSVEVAELLREEGLNVVRYIDLDLNPDPKYGSNSVFRQAVGMCEGMGYEVRFKTLGPLVTTMADTIVRSKVRRRRRAA